jgi:hypothetical protein
LLSTPPSTSASGIFSQNVTGSIIGVELSPYAFNTGSGPDGSAAAMNAAYNVLGPGGGWGSATYNINSSSFTFLWGSPDPYNQIAFYTGPNGSGSVIDVVGGNNTYYDGSNLACFGNTCTQTLFDLVTFAVSSGDIGSVILTDAGPAFEYELDPPPANSAPDPLPLPASLPLFAGGLSALGLLGCRRKRRPGRSQSHLT